MYSFARTWKSLPRDLREDSLGEVEVQEGHHSVRHNPDKLAAEVGVLSAGGATS